MEIITIKTQAELDAVPFDFNGTIYIEGGKQYDRLVLRTNFERANVYSRDSAWIEARESSHVVAWGSSHVVAWGSSHVVARDSSHVVAWGSSHVVARGSSHVVARGSSHVEARDSSHVVAWGSSHVVAWGSSHVVARGSSTHKLYGQSMVHAVSAKSIICEGYNVISLEKQNEKNCTIVVNATSYIMIVPDFEPTFDEYTKRYPVSEKEGVVTMYKAVHKKETGVLGKKTVYFSDYNYDFTFDIGKVKKEECNASTEKSCTNGIHIANKSWAIQFGSKWSDMALLECEVNVKDIVVAKDCDGKVRCSKIKVIREVPKEEYYA